VHGERSISKQSAVLQTEEYVLTKESSTTTGVSNHEYPIPVGAWSYGAATHAGIPASPALPFRATWTLSWPLGRYPYRDQPGSSTRAVW